MDELPHSVLLHILSRLDNSADVARCRVAWKAFDTVSPGVRSISLRSSSEWYARVSNSERIKPLKTVFLDLISKLEAVESVRLVLSRPYGCKDNDGNLTDGDFPKEWLPRVSGSLKSLEICDVHRGPYEISNLLPLISTYCHNLVNLRLDFVYLSLHDLIPMPMLTSLTLESVILEDEELDELNRCFPNLQLLKLFDLGGLQHPMIHHLNLKTFVWDSWEDYGYPQSLTLITPNLTTLEVDSKTFATIHVEAPMLSHFELRHNGREHACALTGKKFENLKTLCLTSSFIGSLLSQFPIIKTVENLTLDSEDDAIDIDEIPTPDSENDASRDSEENLASDTENDAPRDSEENLTSDSENDAPRDSKLTLEKVFTVFPNVRSLCIKAEAWSELEFGFNREGWDGRKGWKTICAYLKLVDPVSVCFLSSVLDQFVSLSEVSLLIHADVVTTVAESFMSRCMGKWPGLKWRWGVWGFGMKDRWITDVICNEHHRSSKKRHLC